ncbi:PorV/PorQ family protein, partial [Candidatus Aerophobetes bacterium]|nr:PorV/PorQ family protein [Candidatus Aerophobetes bacterium]
MRKALWSAVIIGILILTFNLVCYANGPGTTTASFLKIGVGARPAAMGEAFTALADDGTSLYWNPAGLTQIKQRELSATYNLWFQEIRQGYLSFGFPSLGGTVGLGANYVDMGDIEGRDEEGNPTGDFGASDTHLFAGYADKFKNISWGITVGWLEDKIEKDTKTTFLANIGLLYPLGERFILGVVAQNIGSKLGSDPLPLTF